MRYIILILGFYLCSAVAFSQIGLCSYSTNGLQNFRLNPALTSFEKKLFLGLGHVNFDAQNSAGNLFEAIEKNNNDELLVDLGLLTETLEESNTINVNNEVMSFYLGTKFRNWRIGLYHSFRTISEVQYSKDLVELLWYGNAPFVGERLNVGPSMDFLNYNQVGLHLAYNRNKLNLGININRVFGTAYAQTNKSDIEFYTDPEFYEISINTDYETISASSLSYADPATLEVEEDKWYQVSLSGNTGWSVDLGVSYEITEKLMIHGFLKDLGFINFDENVQRIFSNKSFDYSGGTFDSGVLNSENDFQIEFDTILSELEFEAETSSGFEHSLSTTLGLGLNYQFNEKTELYLLGAQQQSLSKQNDYNLIQLGIHRDFFKIFKFNANYSYKYESSNLGMGLSIHPGPLDFFLYTDNILNLISFDNGQRTAIMLGFSCEL